MDVENPKLAVAGVSEAVNRLSVRPSRFKASTDDLVRECELGRAFENIEGINVVSVGVWVNAESRDKARIDHSSSGRTARTRW
jgi:hypothetical protein